MMWWILGGVGVVLGLGLIAGLRMHFKVTSVADRLHAALSWEPQTRADLIAAAGLVDDDDDSLIVTSYAALRVLEDEGWAERIPGSGSGKSSWRRKRMGSRRKRGLLSALKWSEVRA